MPKAKIEICVMEKTPHTKSGANSGCALLAHPNIMIPRHIKC